MRESRLFLLLFNKFRINYLVSNTELYHCEFRIVIQILKQEGVRLPILLYNVHVVYK